MNILSFLSVGSVSIALLSSGCSTKSLTITPWPGPGYTMAPIPSEKYTPGSIVYMQKGAIVKVAEIAPPASARQADSALAPGTRFGTANDKLTLGIAVKLVGVPAGGTLAYTDTYERTYSFTWDGAGTDLVLIIDKAYEPLLLDFLDTAAKSPLIQGQKLFLIQESAKAKGVDLTINGKSSQQVAASVTATINQAVDLTPKVETEAKSDQTLTIKSVFPKPLYVSFILVPLKVAKGDSGQRQLIAGKPVEVESLTEFVDQTSK